MQGELSYSRVREVSRVATSGDEALWLDAARMLSMGELERRVAGRAFGQAATVDKPAEARWRTPETVELAMELPAEAWALLSRAMQGARLASEGSMSDAEALAAVAREALAGQIEAETDASAAADPRRALVLYSCRHCGRTELETNAGAVELSAAAGRRLGCGAKVVDLQSEGRQVVAAGGVIPAAVRRAVLARDRARCQTPGCGRRRYVDVHHIEPLSAGGVHSRRNCICACTTCHAAIHEGKLRVEGDAEGELRWHDAEGRELGGRGQQHRPQAATAKPTPNAELEPDGEADAVAQDRLSAEASAVLVAMGSRGGWMLDALADATALPVGALATALTELELSGEVTSELGMYEPAGSKLQSEPEPPMNVTRGAPQLGPQAKLPFALEPTPQLGFHAKVAVTSLLAPRRGDALLC